MCALELLKIGIDDATHGQPKKFGHRRGRTVSFSGRFVINAFDFVPRQKSFLSTGEVYGAEAANVGPAFHPLKGNCSELDFIALLAAIVANNLDDAGRRACAKIIALRISPKIWNSGKFFRIFSSHVHKWNGCNFFWVVRFWARLNDYFVKPNDANAHNPQHQPIIQPHRGLAFHLPAQESSVRVCCNHMVVRCARGSNAPGCKGFM